MSAWRAITTTWTPPSGAGATSGWIPRSASWSLEADAELVDAPTLLIQGVDDPYGTLDQLDRIAARVRGPVGGWSCRAATARTSRLTTR